MNVVVFANASGGVGLVVPAPGVDVEAAARGSLPSGTPYWIVDQEALPPPAWIDGCVIVDGAVVIDMDRCRELVRGKIRLRRVAKLSELDVATLRALSSGKAPISNEIAAATGIPSPATPAEIESAKQAYRDATSHPSIAAARTLDDLKQVNPLGLL